MPQGAGKYDPMLSLALEAAGATQGILMVMDGDKGVGFSIRGSLETMAKLPNLLEVVAAQIREDIPSIFEGAPNGPATYQ